MPNGIRLEETYDVCQYAPLDTSNSKIHTILATFEVNTIVYFEGYCIFKSKLTSQRNGLIDYCKEFHILDH